MPKYLFFIIFLFSIFFSHSQINPLMTLDSLAQETWVETKYKAMTMEEKVGQLFMVSIASNQNDNATDAITKLIKEEHIGGVIFSKGSPVKQAKLTNTYQEASKIPLLIGMDAEASHSAALMGISRRKGMPNMTTTPMVL